jgi:hypothetical protein
MNSTYEEMIMNEAWHGDRLSEERRAQPAAEPPRRHTIEPVNPHLPRDRVEELWRDSVNAVKRTTGGIENQDELPDEENADVAENLPSLVPTSPNANGMPTETAMQSSTDETESEEKGKLENKPMNADANPTRNGSVDKGKGIADKDEPPRTAPIAPTIPHVATSIRVIGVEAPSDMAQYTKDELDESDSEDGVPPALWSRKKIWREAQKIDWNEVVRENAMKKAARDAGNLSGEYGSEPEGFRSIVSRDEAKRDERRRAKARDKYRAKRARRKLAKHERAQQSTDSSAIVDDEPEPSVLRHASSPHRLGRPKEGSVHSPPEGLPANQTVSPTLEGALGHTAGSTSAENLATNTGLREGHPGCTSDSPLAWEPENNSRSRHADLNHTISNLPKEGLGKNTRPGEGGLDHTAGSPSTGSLDKDPLPGVRVSEPPPIPALSRPETGPSLSPIAVSINGPTSPTHSGGLRQTAGSPSTEASDEILRPRVRLPQHHPHPTSPKSSRRDTSPARSPSNIVRGSETVSVVSKDYLDQASGSSSAGEPHNNPRPRVRLPTPLPTATNDRQEHTNHRESVPEDIVRPGNIPLPPPVPTATRNQRQYTNQQPVSGDAAAPRNPALPPAPVLQRVASYPGHEQLAHPWPSTQQAYPSLIARYKSSGQTLQQGCKPEPEQMPLPQYNYQPCGQTLPLGSNLLLGHFGQPGYVPHTRYFAQPRYFPLLENIPHPGHDVVPPSAVNISDPIVTHKEVYREYKDKLMEEAPEEIAEPAKATVSGLLQKSPKRRNEPNMNEDEDGLTKAERTSFGSDQNGWNTPVATPQNRPLLQVFAPSRQILAGGFEAKIRSQHRQSLQPPIGTQPKTQDGSGSKPRKPPVAALPEVTGPSGGSMFLQTTMDRVTAGIAAPYAPAQDGERTYAEKGKGKAIELFQPLVQSSHNSMVAQANVAQQPLERHLGAPNAIYVTPICQGAVSRKDRPPPNAPTGPAAMRVHMATHTTGSSLTLTGLNPRAATWTQSQTWASAENQLQQEFSKHIANLRHIDADKSPVVPRKVSEYANLKAEIAEESQRLLNKEIQRKLRLAEASKVRDKSGEPMVPNLMSFMGGKSSRGLIFPAYAGTTCFHKDYLVGQSPDQVVEWPTRAHLRQDGRNRIARGSPRVLPLPRRNAVGHQYDVRGQRTANSDGSIPYHMRAVAESLGQFLPGGGGDSGEEEDAGPAGEIHMEDLPEWLRILVEEAAEED